MADNESLRRQYSGLFKFSNELAEAKNEHIVIEGWDIAKKVYGPHNAFFIYSIHPIQRSLFKQDIEKELYESILKIEERVAPLLEEQKYLDCLLAIESLSPIVNRFLDEVYINVDDAELKENRLNIMRRYDALMNSVADLSKIHGIAKHA